MRRLVQVAAAVGVAAFGLTTPAAAQPAGDRPVAVEFNAGVAAGGSTSGAFGLEASYAIRSNLTVFLEVAQMANVAPGFVQDRADTIAKLIGGSADPKDKATLVDLGIKYNFASLTAKYQPYAGFAVGGAKVAKDAGISVGGKTLSESDLLTQYGVQLGSDLADSMNKTAIIIIGGVTRSIGERYGIDLSYRYGAILAKTDKIEGDKTISTSRLLGGFFVRF
jgi:hypothetical protein